MDNTEATRTFRYQVISLDVWGHGPEHEKYGCNGECDGYTVNAAYHTSRRISVVAQRKVYNFGTPNEFVAYDPADEDIVKALVEAGELNEKALADGAIEIGDNGDGTMLYVHDGETDCPLLHLQREEAANG